MAYALVGSAGAVSQSASGASVTPSYGQAPTAGHLLILWVIANNSALPATPTGWSLAVQTTTAVKDTASIFYKVAAGGDAAPTVAAVASTVLSVQLAEFSGNATTSPLDQTASTQSSSTAAPLNLTLTAGAPDAASGELIVTCSGMHLGGGGGAETISDSFSNATITVLGNNDATATTNHYHFAYGVTTSNSAADSDSWSATSGTANGSAAAFASFKLAPAVVLPPPTATRSAPRIAALRRGRQAAVTPAPVPVPSPVFPNRIESTRNRNLFVVRGHRTFTVPTQAAPVLYPWPNRTSSLARRLFALQPRGKRLFPAQPQVAVPPTVPGNRAPTGRRWAFPVRGKRSFVTPQQDPVWPTRIDQLRSRFSMLRHGRQVSPVPAQVPVPPRIPGNRSPAGRRWSSPARGRRTFATPEQSPVWPGRIESARSKLAALRRGRATNPVLAQASTLPPPYPPPRLGAARRLLAGAQRGRQATPTPAQSAPQAAQRHPPKPGLLRRARRIDPPVGATQVIAPWSPATVRRSVARLLAARLGARSRPAPPGSADPPPTPAGHPAAKAPSRLGSRPRTPTPGQLAAPPSGQSMRRARVGGLRKGRRADPIQPQIPVPAPVWPNRMPATARRMFALAPRGKRWPIPAPVLRVVIPLAGLVSPMFRSGLDAVLSTFGRTAPGSRGGQASPGSKPGRVNPSEKQGDDSI